MKSVKIRDSDNCGVHPKNRDCGEKPMSKLLKGFITYSHEDAAVKEELRKRLAIMEEKNEFTTEK